MGRTDSLDRKELSERSGASDQLIQEAISQGLIPAGSLFDQHHLRVMESLAQAEHFGLTPRHLRGMRVAVEREIDLVRHAVDASSGRNAKAKRSQREMQRELSDVVQQLRVALVRQALDGLES